MNISDQIASARDQLNRTLTFFPRVDSKASVVLGVNTGLLAVLATRAFPYAQSTVGVVTDWICIALARG